MRMYQSIYNEWKAIGSGWRRPKDFPELRRVLTQFALLPVFFAMLLVFFAMPPVVFATLPVFFAMLPVSFAMLPVFFAMLPAVFAESMSLHFAHTRICSQVAPMVGHTCIHIHMASATPCRIAGGHFSIYVTCARPLTHNKHPATHMRRCYTCAYTHACARS